MIFKCIERCKREKRNKKDKGKVLEEMGVSLLGEMEGERMIKEKNGKRLFKKKKKLMRDDSFILGW